MSFNEENTIEDALKDSLVSNGWYFWKYKDKNGNLVKLAELRK